MLELGGFRYSGFDEGAGEIAAAELLATDYPKYGLFLVDEIETSLHPRAQRRLIRDLATIARANEMQIVLTTHSPFVLNELPPEARIHLMDRSGGKSVVAGVSPEFAMTRMDEEQHPECDLYVQDARARALLGEFLTAEERELVRRSRIIEFGAASVGHALGQMVSAGKFLRPSLVFLDALTVKEFLNLRDHVPAVHVIDAAAELVQAPKDTRHGLTQPA